MGGRIEGSGGGGGGARLSMIPHDGEGDNYDTFEVGVCIYK